MSDDILNSIDGRRLGWTHDNNLHFRGQGIQEFSAGILDIEDTSYTLAFRDTGSVIVFWAATAVTVTLPAEMPRGFNCAVVQWGAGAVQFNVESGAAVRSRFLANQLGGQYAMGTFICLSNADGASAQYIFGGDGA